MKRSPGNPYLIDSNWDGLAVNPPSPLSINASQLYFQWRWKRLSSLNTHLQIEESMLRVKCTGTFPAFTSKSFNWQVLFVWQPIFPLQVLCARKAISTTLLEICHISCHLLFEKPFNRLPLKEVIRHSSTSGPIIRKRLSPVTKRIDDILSSISPDATATIRLSERWLICLYTFAHLDEMKITGNSERVTEQRRQKFSHYTTGSWRKWNKYLCASIGMVHECRGPPMDHWKRLSHEKWCVWSHCEWWRCSSRK